VKRLVPIILVTWPSVALAILGCLHEERHLAKRASAIVVATIRTVGKTTVAPCPDAKPSSRDEPIVGKTYEAGYSECGEVGILKVTIDEVLRGELSGTAEVMVGTPTGLILGPCDDRPELQAMVGLQAILYLRRDGPRWWTLDGPDSIYTAWRGTKLDEEFIARVKKLLAEPTQE